MSDERQKDLIFDFGAHRGEDSAYYLARGFRVVAVECDPAHLDHLRRRFRDEIGTGRMTLIDRAIGPASGPMTFYRNRNISVWGTAMRSWADRNISEGTEIEETVVEAIEPTTIFRRYGVPFYLKIDVEGMDLLALRSLGECAARPAYVSIESDATSFEALRTEFETFRGLGYLSFKLSPQHLVQRMKVPPGSPHGTDLDYTFEPHASGSFGEDLPGPWLTEDVAIAEYKAVFVLHHLYDAVKTGVLRGKLRDFNLKYGHNAGGWYDTHARHVSLDGGTR